MNSVVTPGKKIVIVEDEEIVAMSLEESLRHHGYVIPAIFRSGEDALRDIPQINPDLVLMDIRLDGHQDGIEVAEQILSTLRIPVIYLTARSDDDVLRRVLQSAPYGYLTKPYRTREVFSLIEIALIRHRMEKALLESERRYRAIFDNASDAILVNEVSDGVIGPFTEVNDATLQKLGYEREAMLELSLLDICDENCVDDCTAMACELLERGAATCEIILVGEEGRRLLVDVHAHLFALNGKMLLLSVCRDCTL